MQVIRVENIHIQFKLHTGIPHGTDILPVVGTSVRRERQRALEEHVVGTAYKILYRTVNPVEKPEIKTYINGLLLFPCKVGIAIEYRRISEGCTVPCDFILVLIRSIGITVTGQDILVSLRAV